MSVARLLSGRLCTAVACSRADIASPCRQRAARRLDQLRVRGHALLRHPRAAVDAVPGRQPRHGSALEQVLHVDGPEAHSRRRGRERIVASAEAHPVGIALEVRSQCVFQRPMMCGAWIRELRRLLSLQRSSRRLGCEGRCRSGICSESEQLTVAHSAGKALEVRPRCVF